MSTEFFSLAGKRVLVTGGGRGLGRAMAQGLAQAEGTVVVVARTYQQVEDAAQEIGAGAVGLAADVGEEDPQELVDRAQEAVGGPIDVVLHAAGVQHRQPAENFDSEAWDRVLRINLTAPFRLSQEIGRRQLAEGRAGSHIFIGSITSLLAVPTASAYTASKAGVYGVARSLSAEWSGSDIRANVIGPGYFRTQMTEQLFTDPIRNQRMLDRIPMGRFGNPSELAGVAIFLASVASSYVTGQLIMVDGGWTSY